MIGRTVRKYLTEDGEIDYEWLEEITKGGKRMNERINRPKFCYDWNCKVLLSTFDEKEFDQGLSFFCFGKMEKERTFIDKGTIHRNDISHCYYTPLKGMIRFFMNIDDLWGEANAKLRVLNKLKEIKCDKCGGKARKVIIHKCFNCNPNK